jgi:hypothetical protein
VAGDRLREFFPNWAEDLLLDLQRCVVDDARNAIV